MMALLKILKVECNWFQSTSAVENPSSKCLHFFCVTKDVNRSKFLSRKTTTHSEMIMTLVEYYNELHCNAERIMVERNLYLGISCVNP